MTLRARWQRFLAAGGIGTLLLVLIFGALFWLVPNVVTGSFLTMAVLFAGSAAQGPGDGPD